MFEQVASCGTAVSLTLRHVAQQRAQLRPDPARRLLSVQWEELAKRRSAYGLPLLHAGLRRIAEDHQWETWSLGDEPLASAEHLGQALRQPFGLAVIGAHGIRDRAGVRLASDTWCGEDVHLGDVDLLILVACAVGRLLQEDNRDVEGLYARLAAHGARCVVAARWKIADVEAAVLIVEFVAEYLQAVAQHGRAAPFDRARALNRARQRVLTAKSPYLQASFHLAAAFEIYGLG